MRGWIEVLVWLFGYIGGVFEYIAKAVVHWPLLGLVIVPYVFTRLFIVVEAIISVRSLPIGSFETVTWVEYWPHV